MILGVQRTTNSRPWNFREMWHFFAKNRREIWHFLPWNKLGPSDAVWHSASCRAFYSGREWSRLPHTWAGSEENPPETTTLDDTSKFCMEFDHLILRKIIKFVATRMSDFMAKMHQIRRRLRLCPRPRCGSLQRSPRVRSWINGPYLLSVCRAASA